MPSVIKGPILKVANLERLRRSSTLLELRFASRLKNAFSLAVKHLEEVPKVAADASFRELRELGSEDL